jgi:hypothetical protein
LQAFIHQSLDRSTDLKSAYLIGIRAVCSVFVCNK